MSGTCSDAMFGVAQMAALMGGWCAAGPVAGSHWNWGVAAPARSALDGARRTRRVSACMHTCAQLDPIREMDPDEPEAGGRGESDL